MPAKPPKTFYTLQAVGRMMGIPKATIDRAFKDENAIFSIGELKPIAHLFKKFEESDEFSYAILKTRFDKWIKTGIVPKVSPGRPEKYKNLELYATINQPVLRSIYNEFQEIIDNANSVSVTQTTYRDQLTIAIKEYNQRRPQYLNKNFKKTGGDK